MNYRSELIQVAAVTVAMIQDFDHGSTQGGPKELFHGWDWSDEAEFILMDGVMAERVRQEEKWGAQHHAPEMWLAILMEEVGEAAQAYLHEIEAADES
jgi:hypothetical protein